MRKLKEYHPKPTRMERRSIREAAVKLCYSHQGTEIDATITKRKVCVITSKQVIATFKSFDRQVFHFNNTATVHQNICKPSSSDCSTIANDDDDDDVVYP